MESSQCFLSKDLQRLHEMLAVGAEVFVWANEPRTRRLQASRGAYLAMVATDFAKTSLASYCTAVDKVLSKSDKCWIVETLSHMEFPDGRKETHRLRIRFELIEGHALITLLELRLPV